MTRCCDHLFSMLLMTTLINPLTKIPWRAPAKQIRTIWRKRNHPHRHYIDHNCQSSKEKDLFSTNPRLTAQRRRRRLLPACISTWSSVIVNIVIMIIRLGVTMMMMMITILMSDDDERWINLDSRLPPSHPIAGLVLKRDSEGIVVILISVPRVYFSRQPGQ